MCIEIRVHSLVCDARPLLAESRDDTIKTRWVNPWNEQQRCPGDACPFPDTTRPAASVCSVHKCCRVSTLELRCACCWPMATALEEEGGYEAEVCSHFATYHVYRHRMPDYLGQSNDDDGDDDDGDEANGGEVDVEESNEKEMPELPKWYPDVRDIDSWVLEATEGPRETSRFVDTRDAMLLAGRELHAAILVLRPLHRELEALQSAPRKEQQRRNSAGDLTIKDLAARLRRADADVLLAKDRFDKAKYVLLGLIQKQAGWMDRFGRW